MELSSYKVIKAEFQNYYTSTQNCLVDHFGNPIRKDYENKEQSDIITYLRSDAKVLEIGGRFGVVSSVINTILENKTNN